MRERRGADMTSERESEEVLERRRWFSQNNRYLARQSLIACMKPSTDAARMELALDGDSPVTIHWGGCSENWKSRYLAYQFYIQGALECEGSESDRYWRVVDGLLADEPIPSDSPKFSRKTA